MLKFNDKMCAIILQEFIYDIEKSETVFNDPKVSNFEFLSFNIFICAANVADSSENEKTKKKRISYSKVCF